MSNQFDGTNGNGYQPLPGLLSEPAESEGVQTWRERIIAAYPKSESGYWPDTLLVEHMQSEIDELRAALSAVTAERDRLQRNLNFTEQWYAERFERLADLGKSAGCWDAMAAIIANGTADPYEPPTYAQQLVRANHRADVAERERDQLRAGVDRLRAFANEIVSGAFQGGSFDGGDI
ncbi:hypothetical protein [Stutzerimonas balearica]|uniref:hypothetical protein n=1 Tax=Stutzerimonas balearica TaxID=74829 RepID=UPI0028B0EAE6|nr:hypothetical protein [Stutzerimonas balearica]